MAVGLTLASLSLGCGYFMAGRWQDDPKNWGRAFHSMKPPDVVVLHSDYWRSPHWTYEAGYVFEVLKNDALRAQLFTENRLVRVTQSDVGALHRSVLQHLPCMVRSGAREPVRGMGVSRRAE